MPSVGTSGRQAGGAHRQLELLFQSAIAKAFPDVSVPVLVAATNQPEHGDYQCNNAMSLFGRLKGKVCATHSLPAILPLSRSEHSMSCSLGRQRIREQWARPLWPACHRQTCWQARRSWLAQASSMCAPAGLHAAHAIFLASSGPTD